MSNVLAFDESLYNKLPENQKPVFLFDWLLSLEKNIPLQDKKIVRENQEDLIQQLLTFLSSSPGHATQKLIGRCLSNLCMVGDAMLVYTAVNTCNNLLKSRDDGASSISSRLASLTCLGTMYKLLGRLVGRSFEDSVVIMVKLVKQSESQIRCEVLNTLCNLLDGVQFVPPASLKDIYKCVKSCLTDRVLSVRSSAAKCLSSLLNHHPAMYTNGLEALVNLCFRALDGSDYAVRIEVAKLLGELLARSQQQPSSATQSATLSTTAHGNVAPLKAKTVTLSEVLSLLANGFCKGYGGILKGASPADVIKGVGSVSREVRVGVIYSYMEFVCSMGSLWFETNLELIINHCLRLLLNARSVPTHSEAVFSRQCICFLLSTLYRRLLSEPVQVVAARCLIALLRQELNGGGSTTLTEDEASCSSQDPSSVSTSEQHGAGDVVEPVHEDPSSGTSTGTFQASTQETTASRRILHRGSARGQRHQREQHLLVCALDQLKQLFRWLDSSVAVLLEPPCQLVNVLFNALIHPCVAVRLSSAGCLRQLCLALPHQRVAYLDQCIQNLVNGQDPKADHIHGYSAAVSGILAVTSVDHLGLPFSRTKKIFGVIEELFRASNLNGRSTLPRTQSAWLLLAAFMTLGPHLIKSYLPRIFLFWRNAFPRTSRELNAEKQRGDAFTWQVVLEARAGALCSVQCFLESCSAVLVSEEAVKHLLVPVEGALNMLSHLVDIVRMYGNHLKATADLIRYRLYRVLLLLPPPVYSSSYSTLLRELVADFTLTESTINTTTSLLVHICQSDDSATSGIWPPDCDEKYLEDKVTSNCISGVLEYDPASLFLKDGISSLYTFTDSLDSVFGEFTLNRAQSCTSSIAFYESPVRLTSQSFHPCSITLTEPFSLHVALIDSAVELFGRVYQSVPIRHRIQLLQHFSECIRLTKSVRQDAVQVNVFTAVLIALKQMSETKGDFGPDSELRSTFANLVMAALSSSNQLVRCAAAECLGRGVQLIGEPAFLSDIAGQVFDSIRGVRTPASRAGHCLAVGCLHRFVGGFASGQLSSTSVGILLSVAQDASTPDVQIWALHALTLLADSGGPIFREYVTPCLNLVLQLLLRTSCTLITVQRALGRLLGTLITNLGPELQGSGQQMAMIRHSCILCSLIMSGSSDAQLQADAFSCFHRLHMFVPEHPQYQSIVSQLSNEIANRNLPVRRSAVAYLRQLSQKHPLNPPFFSKCSSAILQPPAIPGFFSGTSRSVESQLFDRLNVETDSQIFRDLEDIILTLVQSSGSSHLYQWMIVLKEVLQASNTPSYTNKQSFEKRLSAIGAPSSDRLVSLRGPPMKRDVGSEDSIATVETSEESMGISTQDGSIAMNLVAARWSTRLFAIKCLHTLIAVCRDEMSLLYSDAQRSNSKASAAKTRAHLDLALARKLCSGEPSNASFLVCFLSDFTRIAFMSASSENNRIKLAGLRLLHDIIECFGPVVDPDYDGHSLLEQYQAQYSAAVRPIFSLTDTTSDNNLTDDQRISGNEESESKPEILSLASLVCSSWLVHGLARDPLDIDRIVRLMLRPLSRFHIESLPALGETQDFWRITLPMLSNVFSGEAVLLEFLSLISAWADLYLKTILCKFYPMHNMKLQNADVTESTDVEFSEHLRLGTNAYLDIFRDYDLFSSPTLCASDCQVHKILHDMLQPFVPSLAKAWLLAIKDHALLHLPDELFLSGAKFSGSFFGSEANLERIRLYYDHSHISLLGASSLWFSIEINSVTNDLPPIYEQIFNLLLGSSVRYLTDTKGKSSFRLKNSCLQSLHLLLRKRRIRALLFKDNHSVAVEFIRVLHRCFVATTDFHTHLISMKLLGCVLLGAKENMLRRYMEWCSREQTGIKPTVFAASDVMNRIPADDVTSSVAAQTSSNLTDAFFYNFTEGGSLTFPTNESAEKSNATPISSACVSSMGLQVENSIVFAALESLIGTLFRYQPAIVPMLKATAKFNFPLERLSISRENQVLNDPTAFHLLSLGVSCLAKLPDMCSPAVLLSNLALNRRHSEPDCHDNLLLVLLDLLVAISRTTILQCCQLSNDETIHRPIDDTTYGKYWLSSVDLNTNPEDSEITSTVDYNHCDLQSFDVKRTSVSCHIDLTVLLSWSTQQVNLLDAIVYLAKTLIEPQYPSLVLSKNSSSVTHSFTENLTQSSDAHPDSSNQAGGFVTEIEDSQAEIPHDTAAASLWYSFISSALLEVMEWDASMVTDDSSFDQTCPLVAILLVCQICTRSHVNFLLNAAELRNTLVNHLCKAWVSRSLIKDSSGSESLLPFENMKARRLCLAAIEILTSHPHAEIHRFFIKKLTPMVFRWLYAISIPCTQFNLKDHPDCSVPKAYFVDCLSTAISILVNMVSVSEQSGRQELLFILLPLLCSMICDPAPTFDTVNDFSKSTELRIGSPVYKYSLHSSAVHHLSSIAPKFPTESRAVFAATGDLKQRLENALKHPVSASDTAHTSSGTVSKSTSNRPVIKLRTDFSQFTP